VRPLLLEELQPSLGRSCMTQFCCQSHALCVTSATSIHIQVSPKVRDPDQESVSLRYAFSGLSCPVMKTMNSV
jgi:hypothetical protein